MSKDTKEHRSAIEAVEAAGNGREAVGAYIAHFQKEVGGKLDMLLANDESGQPYLNHVPRDQLDTLAQLVEAMDNTVALNIAQIRKQDAMAEARANANSEPH